jgi:hypothetical protein
MNAPPAKSISTHEEASDMLAPLGFFLLTMLGTLALILLACWARDTHELRIQAARSLPPHLQIFLDTISRGGMEECDPAHSFRRVNHRAGGRGLRTLGDSRSGTPWRR